MLTLKSCEITQTFPSYPRLLLISSSSRPRLFLISSLSSQSRHPRHCFLKSHQIFSLLSISLSFSLSLSIPPSSSSALFHALCDSFGTGLQLQDRGKCPTLPAASQCEKFHLSSWQQTPLLMMRSHKTCSRNPYGPESTNTC